ncbi:exodeoxyribonuclease VII large subunit [Ideonella alba]|uniref:Exodeoxyribonuclease 7 large subunit n=1 Tax=Ideonella alba TaxID=2824118 RepID=A0A940Y6B4_9BURK|nr:exodeoxyribonuclease VII large subunit [Ideonella alba]MBQ0930969.1 exodeoxyribonuclease VII large subunit [Ideonella alba]
MTTLEPASRAWSVGALLLAVGDALSARFASVSVRGELSGFTRAASGHCYFTLKDGSGAGAALRCAMFRRAASLLAFAPRDGQQVELRGRLAVYEARGELQMVVEAMSLVGAGSLYEEFLRLKARLEALGLFDAARKRPLPALPRCVALVTSASGAALHDVVTTLARRAPYVALHLVPSLVQGAEAPASLVRALAAAAADPHAEAILLCRGGGSLEDLWAFNDERVVRAIAASPLPVICGVGHESDITLADLAADRRAATPTAAAEQVAPALDELLSALDTRAHLLRRQWQRELDRHGQRLDLLGLRLRRPAQAIGLQRLALERQGERLLAALRAATRQNTEALALRGQRVHRAAEQATAERRARLGALAAQLGALDPRRVLERGYAWVTDADGQPVLRAHGLQQGQALTAVWADGEVGMAVTHPPGAPG